MKKRLDPREVYLTASEQTDELRQIAESYDKNEKRINKISNAKRESCQNMLTFPGHGYLHGMNAYWCQLFSEKKEILKEEQRELEKQTEKFRSNSAASQGIKPK